MESQQKEQLQCIASQQEVHQQQVPEEQTRMKARLSCSPSETLHQQEAETARQIADFQDSGGILFEERLSCILNKSQP